MKKTELKAGEVVAHRTSKYHSIHPVIVVDADKLWHEYHDKWHGRYEYRESRATRAGRDSMFRNADGYLVLEHRQVDDDSPEKRVERLKAAYAALPALTAENLTEIANNGSLVGVRFAVVSNSHLRGPWEQAVKAAADVEQAEAEQRERERLEVLRLTRLTNAVNAALAERGITDKAVRTTTTFGKQRAHVQLETLMQLLGIEPEEGEGQ